MTPAPVSSASAAHRIALQLDTSPVPPDHRAGPRRGGSGRRRHGLRHRADRQHQRRQHREGTVRCRRGDPVRLRRLGSADELQPVGRLTGLAHGKRPEPAHLRDPAAVQPPRRHPAARTGQGAAGARARRPRAALAGRHRLERRHRPDLRRRGLHLRAGREGGTGLLERVDLPGVGRGHRPADGAVHREEEAVQPGFGQGRHRRDLHRAEARLGAGRSRGDPEGDQPRAGRQRAVHPRALRPDPDQPRSLRRLLGQGGLRNARHDHDQPPDLQVQQRLRPQARERRARRGPDLHLPDLEDVGEGCPGRHLVEGEALLPAGQPAAAGDQRAREGTWTTPESDARSPIASTTR